jgi:hypothetical protein
MGVRIYPRNQDPQLMEALAEVPAGTSWRLKQTAPVYCYIRKGVRYYLAPGSREIVPVRNWMDLSQLQDKTFELIYSDGNEDLEKLNGFEGFGWGKFTVEALEVMEAHGLVRRTENGCWDWDPCGEITDLALATKILEAQGVCMSFDNTAVLVYPSKHVAARQERIPISEIGGICWS